MYYSSTLEKPYILKHAISQMLVIKTDNCFVQISVAIKMCICLRRLTLGKQLSNWVKVAQGLRKSLTTMLYWSNHYNASALGNDNLLALF